MWMTRVAGRSGGKRWEGGGSEGVTELGALVPALQALRTPVREESHETMPLSGTDRKPNHHRPLAQEPLLLGNSRECRMLSDISPITPS